MRRKKVSTELPEKFYDFIMNCDQITDKDKGLSIAERMWNKELIRAVHSKTSFPLSSKYKKILIRDNNDYHYFTLIQENVLEIVKNYSVKGKRCKYVKMRQEFSQSPTIRIEYNKPGRKKKSKREYDESLELKLYLLFEDLTLKFEDGESVESIVQDNYANIKQKVRSKIRIKDGNVIMKKMIGKSQDYDKIIDKFIDLTIKHHKNALYRLNSGDFKPPSRNATNHRMDYILTNTCKDYLRYIRYKDEKLVEIDMSNSQPVLLANLIRKKIGELSRLKVKNEVNDFGNIYIPLLFSENLNIEMTDDLGSFMERCFSGTLYDHREGFRDRDHFKDFFITRIFFDNPNSPRNTEEYQYILRLYPVLINLIEKSKRRLSKKYYSYRRVSRDKKKIKVRGKLTTPFMAGCRDFAIILQKFESDLFISLALKSLLDKGYPVFPKHDSFLVPESYADKVLEELNHIFRDALGGDYFKLRVKQISSKISEDFPSNIQAA